eukprot:TRINITY_DN1932_c0_g1_i1.p1 TRINITY_DN1932_c0_g1~~TRINITY_DN1932_c0_g1_i1.p1  ORF type:complete len:226 (+),score=53.84 TRINITY_DN1932_c0_g1_i1:109-786(+)
MDPSENDTEQFPPPGSTSPRPIAQDVIDEPSGTCHPLENKWTFWYDRRPSANKRQPGEMEQYESNLRAVGTFGTVEGFWRYFNHLVGPSQLEMNANYHFFKDGIKPMWEDASNARGGKWIVQFQKGDKAIIDKYWENLILSLIGETATSIDEVCGAVVSRRRGGDKIAVWTRNKDAGEQIRQLGLFLKNNLGVDPSKVKLDYQLHEDSMRSGSSYLRSQRPGLSL